ncbi:MAG: hypothetical protein BroJett018_10700 [Chloroflexota bacterium]|nr:hypothetical protein [Chloroflexota bacterium]GIK63276.1 MAG: hypothetical protein BroJett018_10700 [Chloroflexota bacterium]
MQHVIMALGITKKSRYNDMPISEDRLYADGNAYILVAAHQTVRHALYEWSRGATRWGTPREWWWLVIEHEGSRFAAIPFEQLRDLLNQSEITMDTCLADLPEALQQADSWQLNPGVIHSRIVDKSTITTAAALQQAEESPGQLLVVTTQGQCVGIISKRSRSFAMATLSLLKMIEEDAKKQSSATVSADSKVIPEQDSKKN